MLGSTLKQMYRDAIDPKYSSVENGIAQMTGVPEFQIRDAHLSQEKLNSIFRRADAYHLLGYAGKSLMFGIVTMAGGAYRGWDVMFGVGAHLTGVGLLLWGCSAGMTFLLRHEIDREIRNANNSQMSDAHPIPH